VITLTFNKVKYSNLADFYYNCKVLPILNGEADMTVLEHHYYFHLPSKTFYTVRRPSSWGPHFATFAFRRAIFESGIRYPDNSMAEDYAFAEFALEAGYQYVVPLFPFLSFLSSRSLRKRQFREVVNFFIHVAFVC